LENLTGELRTDYSDVFAKLQRRVGSRSTIGIGALVAWDDLGFGESEPGEIERVGAQYDSQHLWANIATDWTPRLHSRAVIGGGNLTRDRSVSKIELDEGELSVSDQRSFQFLSLKQDWAFEWNEHQLLKGGIDLRAQRADYDYVATSSFEGGLPLPGGDPSDRSFVVDLEPRGESYAAYLADRLQLAPSVIAEVGLRWDKQFWLEENQISPRAQLRWEVDPRSFLRLAWGRYFQSQRLNELQVEDGVSQFFPAQLSEHWIASAEHWFDGGGGLRIEAYWKDLSRHRPRYENLFNPLELFPEAHRDRVLVSPDAAHSTGLELLARSALHERASWWASYAWAKAVDEIDGETVPRSWDQRHTVNAGLNLTFPRRWNVNLGGTWHTGWPTTAVTAIVSGDPDDPEIELVPGLRNRQRLPDYFRLDLRASRTVPFRSGTLTFIADILNLTNHRNVCCLDDVSGEILEDGSVELTREESTWAPITPTLAVRWRL
jgi:outer membrane receptor protein involved in Fe transport